MSGWPEVVWSAAVLRGLDARARAEMEASGGLRDVAVGETLYRSGEPADAFFVVAEGACEVRAVRRGERDASVIRRALPGEALGEEATLRASASRAMDAVCVERARVAEVKVVTFRRAAGRATDAAAIELAARLERTLRRAATSDLLQTMSFTRELPDRDLTALLDAVEHVTLARGDTLFRPGDAATHVYFVADGMLQVQTEDARSAASSSTLTSVKHVRAYIARGDFVGEDEALAGRTREVRVVASGATWLLAVPRTVFAVVARRHGDALARARRVAADGREVQRAAVVSANTTQHAFKDLYRLDVARSLLVIDQDACVRCGHCAWSCASAHEDGVARIVRRGDKIAIADAATPAAFPKNLLLPNSCQHCANPACMIDCPTGAISRDPRGEVFIREELCIGCGNCAKACPWDNIEMAPRAAESGKRRLNLVTTAPALSEVVAVKCDLCRGVEDGPACVRACPTEAITRIDPREVLPMVLAGGATTAPATIFPERTKAWPWVLGAGLVALTLAKLGERPNHMTTGVCVGVVLTALAAYTFVKRARLPPVIARLLPRRAPVAAGTRVRSRLRAHFIAHLALGVLALGAVVSHAGMRMPSNVAGGLVLAFWVTAITGGVTALAYRFLPARLTRIERGGALPEDLAARVTGANERIFRALSGRTDSTKAIFAGLLRPYVEARLGAVALLARGRSLRAEEARVRASVDRVLASRASGAPPPVGIDELIRLVVERRALTAQRTLQALLRVWLPVHVVCAVLAIVLLLLHVVFALRHFP